MKTRPLKPREEVAPHGASTLLTVLADAPPTMKDKWPHEPDAHDDIALDVWFLRILHHVYYGTRWETVEPHPARAWNENAPFNSRPWSEVRDEFASIWPEG